MSEKLSIEVVLPLETIETIVEQVTQRVLVELRENEGRWLTGAAAAADYLGCSSKRVHNRLHVIPHGKEEGRLVFHTRDLDDYRRSLS